MYKYPKMRDIREDNDMKQKEVADILKISQQKYSDYERGYREIPLHIMLQLAVYYKVSMDYICKGVKRKVAM